MANVALGMLLQLLLMLSRQRFLTATSAQQAELYALTWACPLAEVKIADICTDITRAFGVNLNFVKLWKRCGFFTSSGNKIKNCSDIE